jgi:hypothetical protein
MRRRRSPSELALKSFRSIDAKSRPPETPGHALHAVNTCSSLINRTHVTEAMAALGAGYAGGSARGVMDGFIPFWSRIFLRAFCTLYFGLNLGAGAFLFSTRRNFQATGGFDEQYFAGEEVYFSLALRKLGRFKVLREPVVTSGRKLRMYSAKEILGTLFIMIFGGPRMARSRARLNLWYDGKRETDAACE